jgi:hypothetical protein
MAEGQWVRHVKGIYKVDIDIDIEIDSPRTRVKRKGRDQRC